MPASIKHLPDLREKAIHYRREDLPQSPEEITNACGHAYVAASGRHRKSTSLSGDVLKT